MERAPEIIWLIARRKERLFSVMREMVQSGYKGKAVCLPCDLEKEEDREKFRACLEKYKPKVSWFAAFAGFGIKGRVEEIEPSEAASMVRLNGEALIWSTRLVLPYMIKGGRIVEAASLAALYPQPDFAVYAASKACVLSFSKALAAELKKENISVTILAPGPVKTEFFDRALKNQTTLPWYKKLSMAKPKKVIKKGLRDAKNRKRMSVYGLFPRLLWKLSPILPEGLIMKFHG